MSAHPCAFCVYHHAAYVVVGADSKPYYVCAPCVREAREFRVDDAWLSCQPITESGEQA